MKDRKGVEILPSDFVSYFGENSIDSARLMVIGIHKKDNLITLFYESDHDCKFHEVKVKPDEIEVEIRKGEPRSSVKKRGKKSWEELQDEKKTLINLEKKNNGELDEWYQPIFEQEFDA